MHLHWVATALTTYALAIQVRQMGKPDPVIYKAAMEMMGLASNEVLAVGDSLEHDISGGPSAYCLSGLTSC